MKTTSLRPARVGTTGWIYPHWKGLFYPERLPSTKWLGFLASHFSTVEVNATFYSLTTPRACDRWRAAVPPDFVFALKGSRYITHMKRLRDADTALANFFASGILRLGAQLGPILWQLPPFLPFERDIADRFLAGLPRDLRSAERLAAGHDPRVLGRECLTAPDGHDAPILYALEPRHASWMGPEAADCLRRWQVALVWADTAGKHPSSSFQTTENLAYVRLHGSQQIYEGHYADAELEGWARRIGAWARAGTPAFVYFDNDRDAAAAIDAERLASMIAGRPGERFSPPPVTGPPVARERPRHFGFRSRRAGGAVTGPEVSRKPMPKRNA